MVIAKRLPNSAPTLFSTRVRADGSSLACCGTSMAWCSSVREPRMTTPASLDKLQKYIAQTYFGLRLVLAILAFAFPWLLYIGSRLANEGLAPSLSAYYELHGGLMRDEFVGALWAVG